MIGPYTVRLQSSASSPQANPLYFVYRGSEFVGKSISMPSESDCAWLERQNREGTLYASATVYRTKPMRGNALTRHNRKASVK